MTPTTRRDIFSIWTLGERLARGEEFAVPAPSPAPTEAPSGCGTSCGCSGSNDEERAHGPSTPAGGPAERSAVEKPLSRRGFLGALGAATAGAAAVAASGCSPTGEAVARAALGWEEFFKGNYQLMTPAEKRRTVERLERRWELDHGGRVEISAGGPVRGVLYGYAFNVSRCKGYMDCVRACVEENNLDRRSDMQYIRIFEMNDGAMDFADGDSHYVHEVPAAGHFYVGVQCFQCDVPPCTQVCPVGATWKEDDGIVVVDYDWCIGCRYCEAACPYFARRFNWAEPQVPEDEINRNQHYLGNRPRRQGVVEKCHFCIQRTRKGRQPACAEACPTGARVFGNLLDPDSEIRWVLANKKVFRLKEELGTEPKFWYYAD